MIKKLLFSFLLGFITSAIAVAASEDGVDEIQEGVQGLAVSAPPPPLEFDVGIRRDVAGTKSAGTYFSNDATLKHHLEDDDYADVAMGINASLSTRLDHLDEFLVNQGTWSRNHLSASVFVLVYDTRDETSKLLEGLILAQWNPAISAYDFMVRPSVHDLVGDHKCADFVSSKIPDDSMVGLGDNRGSYTFIHKNSLRPIGDDNNHGDRLALDTISMNPDLLFSLIRRTAHREDLQIAGMGVRYLSTYDACDNCFAKIYSTREGIETKLHTIARSQGYGIYGDDESGEFPYFNLFYSGRPGTVGTTYTNYYRYPDEGDESDGEHITAKYVEEAGSLSYYLDFSSVCNDHKQRLRRRASTNVVLRGGNIFPDPRKIYLNVRKFEIDDVTIQYKLD